MVMIIEALSCRDKERTFIDSITSGPAHNQIAAGVKTALSCMLGRMAGYERREMTWEELLLHGESYQLDSTWSSSQENNALLPICPQLRGRSGRLLLAECADKD